MERTAECHCGSLRAIASGDPEQVDLCHCKACQRRTGTAFHFGATYLKGRVRLEGERKIYERNGDSGYHIRFHFCPKCGSKIQPATIGPASGPASAGAAPAAANCGQCGRSLAPENAFCIWCGAQRT